MHDISSLFDFILIFYFKFEWLKQIKWLLYRTRSIQMYFNTKKIYLYVSNVKELVCRIFVFIVSLFQ